MNYRFIIVFLILSASFSSFFADTAIFDLKKGLLITGMETGLVRFFGVDAASKNLKNGDHIVVDRFTAPKATRIENLRIPDLLLLDDGTIISDDTEFGDIRIKDDIGNDFFKKTDRVSMVKLPWEIVGEYIEIYSLEYAEFLPAFLIREGYGIFIDKILDEISAEDFSKYTLPEDKTGMAFIKIPVTRKPLSLNLEVSASFPGLPLIPSLRSSRPLKYINWKIDGEDFGPPIDYIPTSPGIYNITVNATDILDFGSSASFEVTVKEYDPPAEKKLVFDRCDLGDTVLFLGQRDGYWQILDEIFHSEKLKWTFDFPGEFDIFFCSRGKYEKYRVIVQ